MGPFNMKLEGLRVIDLSQFLPGPYLTQVMADHGAEVLKIEPPSGEPVRNVGYRTKDGITTWFRNTHRNKKSIVLDLKKKCDLTSLFRLVENADVFVEAFRPGVVGRLGIDYDKINQVNPRIIYASISAFGQTGPNSATPAHDLAIQAVSGTLSLNLGSDAKPTNTGMPIADITGSMSALAGILMALYRREKTQTGDYIDISMQDSLISWLPNVTGPVFAENRAPDVKNERSFGGYAFFQTYQTKDHKFFALGGVEQKFVRNFLDALGRVDLIEVALGPNGPNQKPVIDFLDQKFKEKTRKQWEKFIENLDVCAAPVLNIHEALLSEHIKNRQMLIKDQKGFHHLGIPIKFRNEPGSFVESLPDLGQHNEEYLGVKGD